jgi:exopolyphosphatase/guanosine-5'-triphosphate,3'-diphosphate pyrophosphatase
MGTPPTGQTQRVAVCDLGTFSALFLIAEVRRGRLEPLLEERCTLDLAYSAAGGHRIPAGAVDRALGTVEQFDRYVDRYACDRAAVVCTAAIRHATNRRQIVERLRRATAHPVVVLSPRQEGMLTAAGAANGLRASDRFTLVVDVGGGSTEIICPETGEIWLIPCGAAWATEQWRRGRPRFSERRADYYRRRASESVLTVDIGWLAEMPRVIGVGGTITTLAAINAGLREFDPARLHGSTLARGWIARMANQLALMDQRAVAGLIPFDRDRARVLTAGTFLWEAVLNRLHAARATVSVRGLRWGVAQALAFRPGTISRILSRPVRQKTP